MILEINLQNYLLAANISHFIFSMFIVTYIRASLENQSNSYARFVFKRFWIVMMICLGVDMLSYIFDTRTFFSARFFNSITTLAAVFMTVFVGCYWNYFFDVVRFKNAKSEKVWRPWYTVLLCFTALLLIANEFTGWLFYIDDNNVYHRGHLVLLSFALQYALFAVLLVRVFVFGRSVRTLRYAKIKNSFMWICIIMLVFGILQILAGGIIALQSFGITAGAFIMFLLFQDDQITNDMLTGLNNRHAFDSYIIDKLHTYENGSHGGNRLYLVLMDINNFKRINDNYGHIEGDKALKTVATALKRVGGNYSSALFISRFGGDEFAAVYESPSEKRVITLCKEIKKALIEDTEDSTYRLTIGAGYAVYTGKEMTLTSLYEIADKALYEDKNAAAPL